jgi:hypothetical protein
MYVAKIFDELRVAHVVVFVLSLGMTLFMLVGVIRPFLRRVHKEKRQIAELLCQLPAEMDVEELILEALAGELWSMHTSQMMLLGSKMQRAGGCFPAILKPIVEDSKASYHLWAIGQMLQSPYAQHSWFSEQIFCKIGQVLSKVSP